MNNFDIYNAEGKKVGEQKLNPEIFGVAVKPELIHQVIVAQQANSRQVLAHTKDRSEVRGGGKKPWRQKGTGRARHGSIRSPLWIGGGITFGPTKYRNFTLKINKKVKRKALQMALSDHAQNESIVLLEQLEVPEIKTKKIFEILQNLHLRPVGKKVKSEQKKEAAGKATGDGKVKPNFKKSILVAVPEINEKLQQSFKNIPRARLVAAQNLSVIDVIKYQILLMPVASLEKINQIFSNKK